MTQPDEAAPVLLLIDDHPLRRASLARFLQDLPQGTGPAFQVIETSSATLPDTATQGVALVLVSIGGALAAAPTTAETLQRLVAQAGEVPVAVLSDHDTAEEVVASVAAGARGFLTTRNEPRLLFSALRFILAGGSVFPPEALLAGRNPIEGIERAGGDASPLGLRALTLRQRDVLRLLGQGQSNKRIAIELRMCESTVKVHVRQIMRKLKAANRTQAALLAQENIRDAEEPPIALDPATVALAPTLTRECA